MGSFSWVRSNEELAQAIQSVREYDAVAVDTEFRRRDTFFPQVALVQLAVEGHCWLIDPLTLTDTDALKSLLTDPSVIKVLHSASEDLEIFEYWLGVLPRPLFDTQKAAAMLNMGFGLSYRAMVEQMLGVVLSKEETQSDWLARPLSDAQCEYAAQDVTYLCTCWPMLRAKADARGVFAWILAEGEAAETGGRGPLAKFKSAWKLKPVQLGVLMALVTWRETEARRRDKPRSWILADKVMTELAQKMPENLPKLGEISGIPHSVIRRDGRQLIELIATAANTARAQPPTPLPAPANGQVRALAKALAGPLAGIAEELEMNVEVLLAGRELELIAREALGESIDPPAHWVGWRATTVIEPLRRRARVHLESQHEAG